MKKESYFNTAMALEQIIADQMEIGAEFSDAFFDPKSELICRVHEFDDCSEYQALIFSGKLRLVPPICSQDLYLWMKEYADSAQPMTVRFQLQNALNGIGAVWKFRNVLYHDPSTSEDWDQFKRKKLVSIAKEWLEYMRLSA